MPYVSRNAGGTVNGAYANLQPDYAEEYLPDDDPEVAAFLNPPPPIPAMTSNRQMHQQLTLDGLLTQSEAKKAMRGTLPVSVIDYIDALPATEQFDAELRLLAIGFPRDDKYVIGSLQHLGVPDVDQFFTAAVAL